MVNCLPPTDRSSLGFYPGPGAFKRAVAAQQLAWCVRRVGYSGLSPLVGFALPVILAAADDTSPAVQRQGLWALHHLAKGVSCSFPDAAPASSSMSKVYSATCWLAVQVQSDKTLSVLFSMLGEGGKDVPCAS